VSGNIEKRREPEGQESGCLFVWFCLFWANKINERLRQQRQNSNKKATLVSLSGFSLFSV